MKRVSVCMATYNGEKFIAEQLESILSQLSCEDEIIISDDSSTDETINIIKRFDDPRINLVRSPVSRSVVINFENALRRATGDYIFLVDQDDIWKHDKVNHMIHILQSADLVVSNCDFVDETGKIIGSSYFDAYKSGEGFLKNFIKNTFLGNCMAFKRSVLIKSLPFPTLLLKASKLALYHDVWIGLLASLSFKVVFIPDKLSSYRRHSNNASPTELSAKSPNNFLQKVTSRYLLTLGLIGRMLSKISL